ncbi:MAG TPA: MFS transporter [Streptosporangiaceae bacterium]
MLRHRDFALLWAGQSVSMIGDGIFTVALALEALRLGHSAAALSFVLAARIGPAVCLLLIGGVVVDRAPRKPTMLAGDICRGIAVGLIAVVAATGAARLWQLVVMAVIFGVADAFFSPASTAIVPELLPADLLVQGSSIAASSKQACQRLIGPALGGFLIAAVGNGAAFGADAASFAVGVACLLAVPSGGRPAAGQARPSMLAQAREGLRYCASRRWLWLAISSHGFINLVAVAPLSVLVPLLIEQDMRQSGAVLGLVLAAGGVGGLAGAILAGRARVPRRRVTATWVAGGAAGAATAALAAAASPWYAAAFFALIWACATYGNALWMPILQEGVPREMLGRASSIEWIFSFAGSPLGIIGAGLLVARVGVRPAMLGEGILAALATLGVMVPGVRDPELAEPELAQLAPQAGPPAPGRTISRS